VITVPGMLAALADSPRTANRHALLGNDPATFAELHARALARVDELASLGVGHGSIVAVLCYNETFVYEYLVAAGYLGAALMPLSPALTDHELQALVDKADAAVLMVSPRVERRKADSLRSLIGRACEPVEPPASGSRHERPSMPRADSTCWVSPTGGSTGTPRLFAISHERLLTNSVLNAYEWGWSRYAFHLAISPIAHGIGFSHSVGQLITGEQLRWSNVTRRRRRLAGSETSRRGPQWCLPSSMICSNTRPQRVRLYPVFVSPFARVRRCPHGCVTGY
jgi:fatty-acyl-CoA synthase